MNRGKRVFATNNDFQSPRFESALHVNTSFTLHFRPSHCINTFHRKGNFVWSRRTVHEMIQFASAGSILCRRTERFLRYNETSLESRVSRAVFIGVRRQAHVRGVYDAVRWLPSSFDVSFKGFDSNWLPVASAGTSFSISVLFMRVELWNLRHPSCQRHCCGVLRIPRVLRKCRAFHQLRTVFLISVSSCIVLQNPCNAGLPCTLSTIYLLHLSGMKWYFLNSRK